MNAILKFPMPEDVQKKRALVADLRPDPVLRTFSRDDSRALLGVAQKVHRGTQILVELVDSHRDVANLAGIETVTIELGSERKNIERILDTLEESEKNQSDVRLSLEGLELLRRTEKLIAEAESNISRFTAPAPSVHQEQPPAAVLGQAGAKSTDAFVWGSLLIVGIMAIGVVVLAITTPGKSDP
jgi:hypothetical protein